MASCNTNSSNLLGNLNINSITSSGARLLMTHPLSGFSGGIISGLPGDDGVTAGDAIRYDNDINSTSYQKYIKAQANTPANCEVIGIVESVTPVNPSDPTTGVVTVIIQGQINYPPTKLVNATHIDAEAGLSGAAGGQDVYFLSAATAGVLQNLAPTEPTQVIKPIYQVAPDSPWTGQVVNYIGYQAGGSITGEDTHGMVSGSLIDVVDWNKDERTNRPGWRKLDGSTLNLLASNGETYGHTYNIIKKYCQTTTKITCENTPSTSLVKKNCFVRVNGRKVLFNARVVDSSVANKTITVKWDSTNSQLLDQYLVSGAYLEVTNGSRFKIVSVQKTSYKIPVASSTTSLQIRVDNKDVLVKKDYWMYLPQDNTAGVPEDGPQNFVVSIPTNLKIKEATIEKLTLEDSTATITVLDSLKNLQSASEVYGPKLLGSGEVTSTNTAQINK
jgi:hypothetical protein